MRSTTFRVVVEKHRHASGRGYYFVAYPLGGIVGAVVGQGSTHAAALADIRSALRAHIEAFGESEIDTDYAPEEVAVEEVTVTLPASASDVPRRTKTKTSPVVDVPRPHAAR